MLMVLEGITGWPGGTVRASVLQDRRPVVVGIVD